MQLFIPPLKTRLRLVKPWSFTLHCEKRNETLWDLKSGVEFSKIDWGQRRGQFCDVTLSPGDILSVDRIFIRAGSEHYNSVTFRAEIKIIGVNRKVRFWVSLADANKIKYEVVL